jgi:hypothetical protein
MSYLFMGQDGIVEAQTKCKEDRLLMWRCLDLEIRGGGMGNAKNKFSACPPEQEIVVIVSILYSEK